MGRDMTRITSAQNPLIRRLKALGDKKTREAEGLMLVEGDVMLREALAAGLRPDCALAEEGGRFDQLLNMLASAGARLYEVPRALIEAVSRQQPPRAGKVRPKMRYAHQGGMNPPVIVIHGNSLQAVGDSYRRYLEGWFRDQFGLAGTPLKIEFKVGHNPYAPDKEPGGRRK